MISKRRWRAAGIFRKAQVVASILPFIRARTDFDDETTRLMGEAFDAARASLDGQEQPEHFYEIIAARISKPQGRASVIPPVCVTPD